MKMMIKVIKIMTCKWAGEGGEAHGLLLQPVRMSWLVERSVNLLIIVVIVVTIIVVIIIRIIIILS